MSAICMTCAPNVGLCRKCLLQWLDRKPPAGVRGEGSPWRRWFDGDRYVGEAYANGRQAAKDSIWRTNSYEPRGCHMDWLEAL
jgi:hypothetical protein